MTSLKWDKFSSPINHGKKLGKTINYPTINLDPSILPPTTKPGVYAAWVWLETVEQISISSAKLMGALFFGPRLVLKETNHVLEIFLLDFSKQVYNQTAVFQLVKFIRQPIAFENTSDMKSQIGKDVEMVKKILTQ